MVALAELGGRLLAYLRAANNGRTLQGKGHDGAVIGHIEGQSGMGLERYIVVIERQMGALETLVALERAGEYPQTAALKGYRGYLIRSEEHTSELQSRQYLVCRLLLEKKNKQNNKSAH